MWQSLSLVTSIVATVGLLAGSAPALALSRSPTISSPKQCTVDAVAGKADLWCEGAICSCCYSDGCFICNSQGSDCVWDPGRASRVPDRLPDLDLQLLQPEEVPAPPPNRVGPSGAGQVLVPR
jgi:hypothetical protein